MSSLTVHTDSSMHSIVPSETVIWRKRKLAHVIFYSMPWPIDCFDQLMSIEHVETIWYIN